VEVSPGMGGDGESGPKGSELPDNLTDNSDRAIAPEDMQRAHLYALLARSLAEPMSEETLAIVRSLDGQGDDSELGQALSALGAVGSRTARSVAEEEYTVLFFGLGAGGEMHPYASQYLTGFVYEKPLANLRKDMAALGIAASGNSYEPEDHIAYLCEIMHGLITGTFGEPASLETQAKFFETHMAPWAGQFFTDLEGAESAALYMPVGTIGRLFLAIESDAFGMAA